MLSTGLEAESTENKSLHCYEPYRLVKETVNAHV